MRPRFNFTATALTTALLLALAPACGDDDGGTGTVDATLNGPDARDITPDGAVNDAPPGVDATPPADAMACSTNLSPTDDGTGIAVDLVLSEIDPGNYIELYNNTDSPISLVSAPHWLCARPGYVSLASEAANVTVPARGFAVIPYPVSFTDTDAGGEVVLYKDANFGDPNSVVDFVCWGTNPHATRSGEAVCAGKWGGSCPSTPATAVPDSCAPALTNGAIHRKMSTAGTAAGDYDTTLAGSPTNCVQP